MSGPAKPTMRYTLDETWGLLADVTAILDSVLGEDLLAALPKDECSRADHERAVRLLWMLSDRLDDARKREAQAKRGAS